MRRRKRRRLKKTAILILLPLSVVLMLLPPHFTRPGRRVLLSIIGPVELAMSTVFGTLAEIPRRLGDSSDLIDENRRLQAELDENRHEIDRYMVRLEENAGIIGRLTKLSDISALKSACEFIPVRVVSKDYVRAISGAALGSIRIGIGSTDGVHTGDLVVVSCAVVGKAVTVSPYVTQVRLVTDHDFSIAARTVSTGVEGLLRGAGAGRCVFTADSASARFKAGDFVVTSGFEDIDPPGLLLGTVESVTHESRGGVRVTVKPSVKLDRISRVIVVRRRRRATP